MKDEYISISEFAKRAGVSRQAVYNRLEGDLAGFCKTVNGKKTVSTAALRLFEVKVSSEFTPWDILMQQQKMIESTNRELRSELEFKNKEIEQLREENRKLSEQLLSLSDKVGNTLQAFSQTQLAEKMIEGKKLLAMPEQPNAPAAISAIEAIGEDIKPREDAAHKKDDFLDREFDFSKALKNPYTPATHPVAETTQPETVQSCPPKKRTFFARLFGE